VIQLIILSKENKKMALKYLFSLFFWSIVNFLLLNWSFAGGANYGPPPGNFTYPQLERPSSRLVRPNRTGAPFQVLLELELRDVDTFVGYEELNVRSPIVLVAAVIYGSLAFIAAVLAVITQTRTLFPGDGNLANPGGVDIANQRRDTTAFIILGIIIFFGYINLGQTLSNPLNTRFNSLSDDLQRGSRDETSFIQDNRQLDTTEAQINNQLFLHRCQIAFRNEGRDFDQELDSVTQASRRYPQLPKNKDSQNPYCNR
jgi:hypothetical protein